MNTFTLLGKLVDLDIVYPPSMEGSMVARITLDTYHQGIMQSSYQIALFRGNAEVAVQGYKQGAWALVSGSLDSTLKESNGNTFYNVRLNGKSIELLSGKYPTFITKPRSDQDRLKAHSRIKEAISAPVDEVKTDVAKKMAAENETGHIATNNSKYVYHTKSVVQSRKRLKARYKAKMLSERLIRFQEEGKNNK